MSTMFGDIEEEFKNRQTGKTATRDDEQAEVSHEETPAGVSAPKPVQESPQVEQEETTEALQVQDEKKPRRGRPRKQDSITDVTSSATKEKSTEVTYLTPTVKRILFKTLMHEIIQAGRKSKDLTESFVVGKALLEYGKNHNIKI